MATRRTPGRPAKAVAPKQAASPPKPPRVTKATAKKVAKAAEPKPVPVPEGICGKQVSWLVEDDIITGSCAKAEDHWDSCINRQFRSRRVRIRLEAPPRASVHWEVWEQHLDEDGFPDGPPRRRVRESILYKRDAEAMAEEFTRDEAQRAGRTLWRPTKRFVPIEVTCERNYL